MRRCTSPSSTEAYFTFRAHAAVLRPGLFSALVLLDPVILSPPTEPGMTWADGWGTIKALDRLLDGAVNRRNGWKSKYVFYCLLELILIRKLSLGQKHCNRSRRIPSSLIGIHSRWNCMSNVSSGKIRKLEKLN